MLTKDQREKILEVVRERDALRAQLADADRKAVERERKAFMCGMSLAECYSDEDIVAEADCQYPLPKEEGR